ncbi:MAG: isoprenyl transferase [Bacteroidota bacterium]|nr:isoprenyl transferase [Bacteroidota bacterium]MDX5427682.1 isoprenyl transferase [Bacteroidota bacterium]MDX5505579.1 isoprenyl transferase [Bacteroidota bacterium]
MEDIIKTYDLDPSRMPQHIAVIMDGNGRWAKKQGFLSRIKGHENGVNALRELSTATAELHIPYLTVYAFSTENWMRPKREVDALMRLLVSTLKTETKTLNKNRIRLNAIGSLEQLPRDCFRELTEVMDATAHNDHMTLTLALSYSSKSEITHAVREIAEDVRDGKLAPEEITEKTIANYLYTKNMPDPDLLIRTSGEYRISNYLLWQLAYAELYFSDTLWPDFKKEDLYKAITSFQNRERRFGKTSEQLKSSKAE